MAHSAAIIGSTLVARSAIGGFRRLSARVPIDRQAVRRIGVWHRRVLDALGKLLPHGARWERGDEARSREQFSSLDPGVCLVLPELRRGYPDGSAMEG